MLFSNPGVAPETIDFPLPDFSVSFQSSAQPEIFPISPEAYFSESSETFFLEIERYKVVAESLLKAEEVSLPEVQIPSENKSSAYFA